MTLEEGDLVLCTVEKIIGTTVFVKIEGEYNEKQGSIIFSEIAPGRIRNIRDYVVPKKRIVCKVLRTSGQTIDLSFRRVTKKEQKEVTENYNQEKAYKNILKSVLGKKAEELINEITKKENLSDFIQKSRETPEIFEKLTGKENAKKILEIINQQKSKKAVIKK